MLSDPMLPAAWRVRRRKRETQDVWTLVLEPTDGEARAFRAGQFSMLYAFGVGEAPISISGDPTRQGVLEHTIRAVGPVTRALCAASRGTVLGLRGPYGSAWPLESAEGGDLVFVAGGIGLAPLFSALHAAVAERGRYERVTLLYGARTPADLLFTRALERLATRFDLDVGTSVDTADASWRGDVGPVTRLIASAELASDTTAFVCGPEIMMRYTVLALRDRGLDGGRIHVSMERSMRCAIGLCGHCQLGPEFVCKDGPVFPHERIRGLLEVREL